MNALRYILYTRVSSASQDDNNSHESQLVALQKHVAARSGLIVGVQRETASGGSYLGRPGIRAALDSLDADEADVLLCFDFSRYSRDEKHQQAMMKRVERAGKRIEFSNLELTRDAEGFLTPESRLMMSMNGGFAAYHRAKIRADTMRGRRHAAENGVQPQRKSPLGYHIVRKVDILTKAYPPAMLGQYLIVEELRPVIETMFAMRAGGQPLGAIRVFLESRGITSQSGVMTDSAISRMIGNSVYKGQATYGRMRVLNDESRLENGYIHSTYNRPRAENEVIYIPVPAIVPPELWERANALKKVPRGTLGENRGRWLLSSVLRCPRCGGQMNGLSHRSTGRLVRAYACRAGISPYKATRTCKGRLYDADSADSKVLSLLCRFYDDEEFLSALLSRGRTTGAAPDASRIEAEIDALAQREGLLIEAQLRALEAGADSRAYELKLSEISQQRRTLQEQRQALSPRARPVHNRAALSAQMAAFRENLVLERLPAGSIELQRVHNFLVATLERIDFEENLRAGGRFPHWEVGALHLVFR